VGVTIDENSYLVFLPEALNEIVEIALNPHGFRFDGVRPLNSASRM